MEHLVCIKFESVVFQKAGMFLLFFLISNFKVVKKVCFTTPLHQNMPLETCEACQFSFFGLARSKMYPFLFAQTPFFIQFGTTIGKNDPKNVMLHPS